MSAPLSTSIHVGYDASDRYAPVPQPSGGRSAAGFIIGLTAGAAAVFLLAGTQSNATTLYTTGVTGVQQNPTLQRGAVVRPANAPVYTRRQAAAPAMYAAEGQVTEEPMQYFQTVQAPQQTSSLNSLVLLALGAVGGAVFGSLAHKFTAKSQPTPQPIAMMSTAGATGATGVLMFPGQGTQFVGMAADIIEKDGPGKALMDRASTVLGYDICELLLEGPADKINATSYSQPAVMVSSLAALEELKAETPDLMEGIGHVAGFSLGEITALVAAGAISFEDGLTVVKTRAEAMQVSCDQNPGGMGSITGLDDEKMAELIAAVVEETGGPLQVANYLFPGGRVVSGDHPSVDLACEKAKEMGAGGATKLTVAGAFHTSLMDPAKEAVAAVLADVDVTLPEGLKLYSNVTAEPYESAEQIKELLVQQVVSSVLWEQTAATLGGLGGTIYEVGAGMQLKAMMKRVDKKAFRNVKNIGGWRPPKA